MAPVRLDEPRDTRAAAPPTRSRSTNTIPSASRIPVGGGPTEAGGVGALGGGGGGAGAAVAEDDDAAVAPAADVTAQRGNAASPGSSACTDHEGKAAASVSCCS